MAPPRALQQNNEAHMTLNCVLQDLLLCQMCMQRCELFHKLSHQKYSMYIECAKKVAEKNVQEPMKATTAILNELLADEVWLAQVCVQTPISQRPTQSRI